MSLNLKTYLTPQGRVVKAVKLTVENHVAVAHYAGARVEFIIAATAGPEVSIPYLGFSGRPYWALMNEWLVFDGEDILVRKTDEIAKNYRSYREDQ